MEKLKQKKELIFVLTLIIIGIISIVILVMKNSQFSNILDSLSIAKEYENNATKINKSAESNGTKITIVDAALDDNFLGIRYRIKSDKNLKNMIFLGIDNRSNETESVLNNNNDKSVICNNFMRTYNNSYKVYRYFSKISDNEYELFEIYLVDELNNIDSIQIKLNLRKIFDSTTFNTNSASITGNWDFDIVLNKNNNKESLEYKFDNKEVKISKKITGLNQDKKIELLSVKQNNIITMVELKNEGLYRDFPISVEFVDQDGNILLMKKMQYLIKENTYIFFNKINLNQNITINLYGEESKEKLESIVFNVSDANK